MQRIILVFLTLWLSIVVGQQKIPNAKYLAPGEKYKYESTQNIMYFRPDLRIYCYRGSEKALSAIFQSAQIRVHIDNDDFAQYEGETPQIVSQQYDNQRSIFSFNIFNTKKSKLIKMNPFNQTCVGLETAHNYVIELDLIKIDFWKIISLSIALFIFLSARKLSQTPIFYYLTGIFLGVFASFLVLVYFGSKLFPRKPMMYGMMVGGWALGVYFLQILVDNLHLILMTYQSYVVWYIFTTGFISFVICYRMGPPVNQRSKDLIKWGLQIAAGIMIFYSSHFREASVAIIILLLSWYYFPSSVVRAISSFWVKRFPPKRRLLTNDEYYEQGVKETTRALEELKRYCSSPESKPWKMMTKLKDPQRFASFVEGSSHIQDDEILNYESSQILNDSEISDDDSGSDDEEFENRLHDKSEAHTNNQAGVSGVRERERHSMARTSTPTQVKANGSRSRILYRGYNGNIEISDDDE